MSTIQANIEQIKKRQGNEILSAPARLAFVAMMAKELENGVKHNKVSATKMASLYGIINPNDIKEFVEMAIVQISRRAVLGQHPKIAFKAVVEIYRNQINLSHRTSQSVLLQQYSTPAPISYLAGLFASSGQGPNWIGLEPSAGNGLLTIAGAPAQWVVNEIDDVRRANLQSQGYRAVLKVDSSNQENVNQIGQTYGPFDVVTTNPPFGKVDNQIIPATSPAGQTTKFHIKSLEQTMAIYALNQMKDGGSAGIIVGGHTTFDKASGRPVQGKNLIFLYYLYSNYNVLDVIPINGKYLFSRQGTGFDTRLILIDGRKPHDPSSFPRLFDPELDTPVQDFDELYDRVLSAIQKKQNTTPENDFFEMNRLIAEAEAGAMLMKLKLNGLGNVLDGLGLPYIPASIACDTLNVDVPDAMSSDMNAALSDLKAKVGDVTGFVAQKLKYASKENLCTSLAAEQIDAVALAILNIENYNQGIIIGDQTGIGKGRQAASIIRYAVKNGYTPIFLTEKPNLFTDLYRDLIAIGSGDLVPFIVNALDGATKIKNENGDVIHKPLPKAEQDQYITDWKLPRDANFIMSTYSQLSVGNAKNKAGQLTKMSEKGQFLRHFATNSILILDESHNAAGESLVGQVMSDIVSQTKGTLYLSATFAKRPDNMPLYALKTVLNEANMSSGALQAAFQRGGVALQEIVSSQLAANGQMIRRQRGFEGIEVNYVTLDASAPTYGMPNKSREHRAVADLFTDLIRDIISFQRDFVTPVIKNLDKKLQNQFASAIAESGVKDAGVANTPYFSRVFNVINQMLFAIKADDVADRAIQRLKEGKKPVIAFSSTMGAFIEDLLKSDDESGEIDGDMSINADFSSVLYKALDSVMKYRVKMPGGQQSGATLDVSDLTGQGQNQYYAIREKIRGIVTGLAVSPIDQIKQKIEKAGFRVAEVTGRNYEVVLRKTMVETESGEVLSVANRPTDSLGYTVVADARMSWVGEVKRRKKENTADAFRKFQNNEVDVLMINQAGATGASAHAVPTSKVPASEVKQRVMIVLQAELDINKEVQKRGRINRTGQILKPIYDYVISDIPAEARMMMMLQRKLKSLDANTTSNQNNSEDLLKSDDFLNKYGDVKAAEYLEENLDFARAIDMDKDSDLAIEDLAYRVAGRVAILKTDEQEKFYKTIIESYRDYAKKLYDRGEYDLEVETVNLQAKTLSKTPLIVGAGGRSAFGDTTYIEECEVNNLRKPFLADELIGILFQAMGSVRFDEFNGGFKYAQKQFTEIIETDIRQRTFSLVEKREKILQERIADIPTLAEYRSKKTEEERAKFAQEKELEYRKKSQEEKINTELKIGDERRDLSRILIFFTIGRVVSLQEGETKMIAVVIGIRFKQPHPSKPKGVEIELAVPNGLKTISYTMDKDDKRELFAIIGRGILNGDDYKTEAGLINSWTNATRAKQSNRVVRHIATGNVLQAYNRDDVVKVGSKLIDFTTIDGKQRKGILLPESFSLVGTEPGKQNGATIDVPIKKAVPILRSLIAGRSKQSSDGALTIVKDYNYDFKLIVPKARRTGGDLYTDFELLELVDDNNFNSISNTMVATFPAQSLDAIAALLQRKFKTSIILTTEEFARIADTALEEDKGTDEVAPVVLPPAPAAGVVSPIPSDDDLEFMLMLAEAEAGAMMMKLKLAA